MDLILRPVTFHDVEMCKQWARDIEAEQYQSHIYPHSFNGMDISGYAVLVCHRF